MLVFNSLGILQISRAEPHFHQVPCGCWTKNRGVKPPKWMVKIMENPIKNGWFGGKTHHLKKTPMWNFQGFPRPLSVSIPRSSIGVNCSVASMTSPTATRLIDQRRSRDWVGWHHHWSCGLHEKANDGACDGVSWDTEKKHVVFSFWFEREGRDCVFLPFVVEFLLVMWVKSLLVSYFQWWESQITHMCFESSCSFPYILFIEEILHHLGCVKPFK